MPVTSSGGELGKGLLHDYSTSRAGIVPLGERRSRYHFVALWITLAAGFTYLFLGFQYHDAGFSLGRSVAAGGLGALCYLVYALPAAYLGSRTGQTHALLTRSIFGRIGSALVSLLLVCVAAGWTAFAFNLLATLYDGLFGWGSIVLISVVLAVLGIANNLFGFTGITAFARYLVAPLIIVWMLYLVIKGLVDIPADVLRASPHGSTTLPFLTGVGLAIGSVMWGNEPDTWRYGQPRFLWPLLPFVIAFAVGLVLFVAGGWMMAELSTAGPFDFGPAFHYTVEYSLFGALWLGAVVATVLQVAINDGNYYEMINGGQNVLGQLRGWRRWHTCLVTAAIAAVFTWWFPHLENGFFTVAGWSSIALPSTTVVMCVDQFLLPRLTRVRRPVDPIPSWRGAGIANWPGIVAVLGAVAFGGWGLGLLPGQVSAPALGIVPLEAWLIAGVLYAGLAAITAGGSRAAGLLGFARHLREEQNPVAEPKGA
ncbi:cytosine permease [Solihabitans fulvus]|nr:cytosine permease [Solihabitans fulvus]